VGSFVAISGQKPWPSAGCFVAAYGQFFTAADSARAYCSAGGSGRTRLDTRWRAGV